MDKLAEKLEQIKQKTFADMKERDQLAERIAAIGNEVDEIDAEIETATNAEDVAKIERLIAKRNEKEMRRDALARVLERKNQPLRYFDEVKAVAAEYAAANQAKVDQATAEIEKANRICLDKKIALARILKKQADFRLDCAVAAGIMATDLHMGEVGSVKYKSDALEVEPGEEWDYVISQEPEYGEIQSTVNYLVAWY